MLSLVFLPSRILVFGCVIGSFVALYTMVHHGVMGLRKRYLFKEGWISTIYTAGIWGVPLLYHGEVKDLPILGIVLIYGLLVLINVLIYSYHEYYTDPDESQLTLAVVAGRQVVNHLLRLLVLCVLILITAAFLFMGDAELKIACLLLLGMAVGLGLIICFPHFFHKNRRFGILADGVFLLPGLLLWMW